MSRTSESGISIFRQLLKQIFGNWFDLFALLKDRKAIMDNPKVILLQPELLTNKPFQYATQSLLIPPALISSLAIVAAFIIDPPPTQAERAIDQQKKLYSVLQGAEGKFNDDSIISFKDLRESLARAKEEALDNIAMVITIQKASEIEAQWKPAIISVSFVINSIFFQYLIRRKYRNLSWASSAHFMHLYIVSSALMPIILTGSILTVLLEYSIRFDLSWYLDVHNILILLLALWSFISLRQCAKTITLVADESSAEQSTYKSVANRLVV